MIERKRRVLGESHQATARSIDLLGTLLTEQERCEEGEALLLRAYATNLAALGANHPNTVDSVRHLIELYEAWGKSEKANEWRVRLRTGNASASWHGEK